MRRLTESDLATIIGNTVEGYRVEAARVKDGPCTDSNHYGFILGKNDKGHYVTWHFHLLDDGSVSVYWGHYFMGDHDAAIRDFYDRGKAATHQKFRVTITETLKRTVEVEAGDQYEAEQMVSDDWRRGGYILDASDFTEVAFDAVPIGNELEEH